MALIEQEEIILSDEKDVFFGLFSKSTDDDCTPACPLPAGAFPQQTPVAMSYVPYQTWETPYEHDVALHRGTIFRSLDKPFIGEGAVKNADAK